MKKNVAAIRRAGRTEGLISASMIFSIVLGPLFSQASKAEHFTKFRVYQRFTDGLPSLSFSANH
jgi:hypothetical protein